MMMKAPTSTLMEVFSTTGEPLGLYVVQFPKHDARVFTDRAEAEAFQSAMQLAVQRVSGIGPCDKNMHPAWCSAHRMKRGTGGAK